MGGKLARLFGPSTFIHRHAVRHESVMDARLGRSQSERQAAPIPAFKALDGNGRLLRDKLVKEWMDEGGAQVVKEVNRLERSRLRLRAMEVTEA